MNQEQLKQRIKTLTAERDQFVEQTNKAIAELNKHIAYHTSERDRIANEGQQKLYEYNGRIAELEEWKTNAAEALVTAGKKPAKNSDKEPEKATA